MSNKEVSKTLRTEYILIYNSQLNMILPNCMKASSSRLQVRDLTSPTNTVPTV